jgi:hypothetical protein
LKERKKNITDIATEVVTEVATEGKLNIFYEYFFTKKRKKIDTISFAFRHGIPFAMHY